MNARELARLNRLNRRVVAIEDYLVPDQPLNAVTAHLGDIPSRVVRLEDVLPVTPRSDAELARENRYAARTTLLEEALRAQVGAEQMRDAIGNARPISVADATGLTFDVAGVLADGSHGLAMDGTQAALRVTPLAISGGDLTIEFWFRPGVQVALNGGTIFMDVGDSEGGNTGNGVFFQDGNLGFVSGGDWFGASAPLTTGVTYYCVFTIEGTVWTWSVWEVGTEDPVVTTGAGAWVDPLSVQTFFSDFEGDPLVAELLEEFAVYVGTALSADDIERHYDLRTAIDASYRRAVVADGATAYWRLDRTLGVFVDAIGNQRPAVLDSESGVTRDVPGPLADGSVGVALDGLTNGSARFTPIILPTLAPFSIEFWIRPSALDAGANDGYGTLVGTGPGGVDDNVGLTVYLTNDPGLIGHAAYRFVLYAYDNVNNTQTFNGSDLVLGALYHVAVTFNGTDAVWFLNGVSDGGVAGIGQGAFGSDGVEFLGIGALFSAWDDFPGERSAASLFDEVAVYPLALTAAQIATHYDLRNAPDAGYREAVVADGAMAYWRFESPNF